MDGMKHTPKKTKAGGVILRYDLAVPHVLLIIEKDGSFGFPKGKVKKQETYEQAALRECSEESGIRNLPRGKDLGAFAVKRDFIHFFMYQLSGKIQYTVPEEAIRWLTVSQASERLSDEQANILQCALHRIKQP